jgi:hypothetical protein
MAQEPEKLELYLQARSDEALQLGLSLVEQGVEPGACVLLQKKEKQTKMSIFRKGRTSNYPGSYAPPPPSRTAAHARHRTRASLRAHTTAHVCVDLRVFCAGDPGEWCARGNRQATSRRDQGHSSSAVRSRTHSPGATCRSSWSSASHTSRHDPSPPHSLTHFVFVFFLSLRT